MPEEVKKPKLTRTYLSDVSVAVKENKGSIFRSITEAENQKRKEVSQNKKINKLNLIFLISGLFLVVISIGFFIFINQKKDGVIITPKTTEDLIFSEEQIEIDITNLSTDQFILKIKNEYVKDLDPEKIKAIYLFKNTNNQKTFATFKNLTDLIKANPVERLIKNTNPNFFFGIFADQNNKEPFLILSTNYPKETSLGLREWENIMISDLFTFFDLDIFNDNAGIIDKDFESLFIKNKEIRAIKNDLNKIVFFYAFLDEKNVLITKSENVLEEVLNRFYSPEVKR